MEASPPYKLTRTPTGDFYTVRGICPYCSSDSLILFSMKGKVGLIRCTDCSKLFLTDYSASQMMLGSLYRLLTDKPADEKTLQEKFVC